LSVVIVAFGASLKVQDIGSMTPRLMFFEPTLLILSMLIVGGRRSLTGALVGVVVIAIGNEFSRVTGDAWSDIPVINLIFRPTLSQLFLGGVMLFTMLYRPDGLIKDWELDHLLRDWWRRKEHKPNQLAPAPDLRDRPVRTLYVEHLTVDFGGFRALNDVSLQVSSHEIVGLIGPNGAGKTTLLNAITGFAPVTSGQVRIDNRIVSGKSPHQLARAGLARTFQNLRLFKDLSVQENVAVSALAAEHLQDQAVDPQITRLLVEGNLWEQRYYRANELDYGNQRRLELARAAARIPDFLLLDEPTSGMSDEESARMIEHIRHMATSIGAGVLVIDHDLHFITNLCDRIYVLDYGTLIAHGAPHIIKTDERVRSAYLGG
jgi:branched-chain amino acid transport system permease protein